MYRLNCSRTEKELNWKSNVTLVQGINKLKDYIDWPILILVPLPEFYEKKL